jgi:hypothetical protein
MYMFCKKKVKTPLLNSYFSGIRAAAVLLLTYTLVASCTFNLDLTTKSPDDLRISGCEVTPETVTHAFTGSASPWTRAVSLPAKGRFVEESHYVTDQDDFENGNWPKSKAEAITEHLKRSLEIYQQYDPPATAQQLYANAWQKEWTPQEGGYFGQGAVGEVQRDELTVEMEMWLLTMMWASGERPARGTKYLLTANDRNVVVIAGYETGPSGEQYMGGVTREVHYWLKTNSDADISIALLKDQSLKPGPVTCQ